MKMICLDIDGTLLNSQLEISERTKRALIDAQEKGIIVVLSSARPAIGMQKSIRELQLQKYGGIVSAFNGGEVHQVATEEILYKKYLSQSDMIHIHQEVKQLENMILEELLQKWKNESISDVKKAKELARQVQDKEINLMTYHKEWLYTADDDKFIIIECLLNQMRLKTVKDFAAELDFESPKILVSVHPENTQSVEAAFKQIFGDKYDITSSDPFFIEITQKGINKGNSTELIAQIMGVDLKDVVAFGDSHNDIPMLKAAGRGIAMGNALDEVKDIADTVTASNDEDGIAIIIEEYLAQ